MPSIVTPPCSPPTLFAGYLLPYAIAFLPRLRHLPHKTRNFCRTSGRWLLAGTPTACRQDLCLAVFLLPCHIAALPCLQKATPYRFPVQIALLPEPCLNCPNTLCQAGVVVRQTCYALMPYDSATERTFAGVCRGTVEQNFVTCLPPGLAVVELPRFVGAYLPCWRTLPLPLIVAVPASRLCFPCRLTRC